jgi:hypothetical protein
VHPSLGEKPDIDGNDAFRTPDEGKKKHELKVTYFCYKCVARDYVHLQFVDVIRHFFRLGWYLMSEIL